MSYTKGKLHISKAYSKSVILDKGDIEVADCFGSTIGSANATAAELVKRWNCHEDLVAACELGINVMIEQHTALENITKGIAKKAGIEAANIPLPPITDMKAALAAAKE